MTTPADEFKEYLAAQQKEFDDRMAAFKAEQASAPYQAEIKRLNSICADFLRTVTACWTYSTRIPKFSERSMIMRSAEVFVESTVCMNMAVTEGARNPARRELRYLIELAIKALFVDQSMPTSSFDNRVIFFDRKVNASGITPEVNELKLYLVPEEDRPKVVASLIALYARACQYVHPSVKQIEERVALAEKGITIGYDNAAELRGFNNEAFEALSLVLFLIFHDLGPSSSGDMFVDLFSTWENWAFHSNKYIAKIDEGFDYKAERQAHLEELKRRRIERLS